MILFQYLIPQHATSHFMGWLANCEWRWFKNLFIKTFIKIYHVNMQEALEPNPENYSNFNNFFTRALKPEVRPIVAEKNAIACPADGYVAQIGTIQDGKIFQAKNFNYTTTELLGASNNLAQQFQQGNFATIYLAPKNYHRVHMPLAGKLTQMIYVPGKLFSVSMKTANHISNVFARNERVVSIFETEGGLMAVILVGAMIVASIETVWAGEITPPHSGQVRSWDYTQQPIQLVRGQEMGRFKMGSTAIVLFPANRVTWAPTIRPENEVKMGELLGTRK